MAEAKIEIILSNGARAGSTLKELTKQANSLNKEIKDLQPGTAAFAAKSSDLQRVNASMGDIKNQIKGTTEASNGLKSAFDRFVPFSGQFAEVGKSLGIAKSGVGGLTSSFGLLRTAIIATGIGALVVGLVTLFMWFKKTDQGATLLSGIFRGLGIVVDKVFGGMIDLFKNLAGYFNGEKSIKQGLIDLVEFIGNNLLNRVKAFAVIWDGIVNMDLKKVADGFIQMGTGIENATDKIAAFGKEIASAIEEGIDLEQQMDAIEDRARELSVINEQSGLIVDQLMLKSKNAQLSIADRIALLDKASKVELANHQMQLENAKALEALRKREIDDNAKRNISNDELDQAYADAQKARIALDRESIVLQEKIANRRAALIEKEEAEQKKRDEDERKRLQYIEDLRIEAMQEGFDKELAHIQLETERKIEALTGTEEQILEQKLLLKEIEGNAMIALADKFQMEQAARDKKAKEEQEKREKDAADKAKKIAEDKAKFDQEMQDIARDTAIDSFSFISGIAQKAGLNAKKLQKAQSIVEIGINLQRELSANAAHAALLGPIAGPIYLASKTPAAIIRAALGAAKVLAFKKGGDTPSSSSDDTVVGAVHANEYVVPAWQRRDPRFKGAINYLETGRRRGYKNGGPVSPMPDRAPVRSAAAQNFGSGGDASSIREAIAPFVDAINSRFDRLKVVNVATETQDVIDDIKSIENAADI